MNAETRTGRESHGACWQRRRPVNAEDTEWRVVFPARHGMKNEAACTRVGAASEPMTSVRSGSRAPAESGPLSRQRTRFGGSPGARAHGSHRLAGCAHARAGCFIFHSVSGRKDDAPFCIFGVDRSASLPAGPVAFSSCSSFGVHTLIRAPEGLVSRLKPTA